MQVLSNMFSPKVNILGLYEPIPQIDILSPYSRRICGLVAEGYTSQDIADKLDSNSAAVDVMVSRAMQKVGVKTRAGLAVWFFQVTVMQSCVTALQS
jgi:DNA-binding NarL/FixJ family response regulator